MARTRDSSETDPRLHDLGIAVRAGRNRAGLTVAELARQVGITGPYVSVLERGARTPAPEVLIRIAAALQLPIAELLALAGHNTSGHAWPPRVLLELATGIPRVTDEDVDFVTRAIRDRRAN
jgi:transcriptional regulator with XRE-family HTH domain